MMSLWEDIKDFLGRRQVAPTQMLIVDDIDNLIREFSEQEKGRCKDFIIISRNGHGVKMGIAGQCAQEDMEVLKILGAAVTLVMAGK